MYKPLVTIATFELPSKMYVIRAKLESEGIECFTKDELTVQVHNFYSNAIGGVKLQVREEDVGKAFKIMQESGLIPEKKKNRRANWMIKLDYVTREIPVFGSLLFQLRLIVLLTLLLSLILILLALFLS